MKTNIGTDDDPLIVLLVPDWHSLPLMYTKDEEEYKAELRASAEFDKLQGG